MKESLRLHYESLKAEIKEGHETLHSPDYKPLGMEEMYLRARLASCATQIEMIERQSKSSAL